MRIATYIPRLAAVGGVEIHLLQALRELAGRGHEIELLYTGTGDLHAQFAGFCASLEQVPSVRFSDAPLGDMRRILPAIARTARSRPDVLYLNNLSELAWAVGVRRLTGTPIVCHLHELAQFSRPSIDVLGARANRFVVASEYMRGAWTQQGIASSRMATIPYGIDPRDYPRAAAAERVASRRRLGLPEEGFVALYMGRLDSEKGVEVLLDAWGRLGLPEAEARLLIVGSPSLHADPEAYLRSLHEAAPSGCNWLPMRSDVIDVLHAADTLVLPAIWQEPFGRVVIETLATGIPVVATRSGGIPETLSGDFSEFLVPRGDASALAARLDDVRHWRRDRPELGERCIEHALAGYSLSSTAARLERELLDACA